MLDVDHSGFIDFDEFYVLICILLAVRASSQKLPSHTYISLSLSLSLQDKQEKDFIVRHSQTVFELLDEDGSTNISANEFEGFSFLFNFERRAVKQMFNEFNVSEKQVSQPPLK